MLAALVTLSPDAIASDPLYTVCAGCHGTGGISQATHIPSIAGLNVRYFYAAMQAFRKDRRPSSLMGRIAKGYKSGQLQRIALHYGSQPWTGHPAEVDPELAARGAILHAESVREMPQGQRLVPGSRDAAAGRTGQGLLVLPDAGLSPAGSGDEAAGVDAGALGKADRRGPAGVERVLRQWSGAPLIAGGWRRITLEPARSRLLIGIWVSRTVSAAASCR